MNPEITLDDVRRFAKLAGLNLSEDQREQIRRSGVYIRAEHIGAASAGGAAPDTTRT